MHGRRMGQQVIKLDDLDKTNSRGWPLRRIVSGGQTGVDRGALDAALELGFPCCGWCPEGRKAEDGRIPERYPLAELPGAGYRQRTRQNVTDSDGTLILYFGELTGGTRETVRLCKRFGKPALAIDSAQLAISDLVERATEFVEENGIAILNVAGPRMSSWEAGYQLALIGVTRLIS